MSTEELTILYKTTNEPIPVEIFSDSLLAHQKLAKEFYGDKTTELRIITIKEGSIEVAVQIAKAAQQTFLKAVDLGNWFKSMFEKDEITIKGKPAILIAEAIKAATMSRDHSSPYVKQIDYIDSQTNDLITSLIPEKVLPSLPSSGEDQEVLETVEDPPCDFEGILSDINFEKCEAEIQMKLGRARKQHYTCILPPGFEFKGTTGQQITVSGQAIPVMNVYALGEREIKCLRIISLNEKEGK